MYKATEVNLELTDKCQAACPMCARNCNGGQEAPHVKNVEMTLENVKQWFTPEWIKSIDRFVASGNNGDPAVAKDCIKIFEYLVEHSNPNCTFKVFTNGSMRDTKWWASLAQVIGNRGEVVFAIDGFAEDHVKYRRNTKWEKIIDNAKAYMAAGGIASANTLVFKHNENSLDSLKEFLIGIGFSRVDFIYTPRFLGASSFPVMNNNGEVEYHLEPPTNFKDMNRSIVPMFDRARLNEMVQSATIVPACQKELYVDPLGNVYPCNHLHRWINETITAVDTFQDSYRSFCHDGAVEIMSAIGNINLHNTDIKSALESSEWTKLKTFWEYGRKNGVCVSACSNLKDSCT